MAIYIYCSNSYLPPADRGGDDCLCNIHESGDHSPPKEDESTGDCSPVVNLAARPAGVPSPQLGGPSVNDKPINIEINEKTH